MSTILWQRIEGGLVFVGALAALWATGTWVDFEPLWLLMVLFFAPDLSFAAYFGGPRVGAAIYNLADLDGVGMVMVGLGLLTTVPGFLMLGLLWTAHAGFDRMLGYGLKEPTGFANTHLGRIGRDRK